MQRSERVFMCVGWRDGVEVRVCSVDSKAEGKEGHRRENQPEQQRCRSSATLIFDRSRRESVGARNQSSLSFLMSRSGLKGGCIHTFEYQNIMKCKTDLH